MEIRLHKLAEYKGFDFHDQDRSGFQRAYVELLRKENGLSGRVLDIGCGPDLPSALKPLQDLVGRLDGVDPIEDEVSHHPLLAERWVGTLETVNVPFESYDLAYSYNVAEHVATPREFMEVVGRCLKPGGVFWSLSNHRNHPFALLVRLEENIRMKSRFAEKSETKINEYPAHYRLNSVAQFLNSVPSGVFRKADFYFYPCVQWDTYWPAKLRVIPHLYDRLLGCRKRACMMIIMARFEKK